MSSLTHFQMSPITLQNVSGLRFLAVSLIAMFMTACGGLGTKLEFHKAAVEPANYTINYSPSYLIGVEKASRERIGGPQWGNCEGSDYCFHTKTPDHSPELQKKVEERFGDPKGHFVSHILRYDRQNDGRFAGKSLYNIYVPDGSEQSMQCSAQGQIGTQACFNSGWDAVRGLKANIEERVRQDHITHIIVMSTGWNTLQPESISNYNEWIANILAAAQEDGQNSFRPLFIGFSWASDWEKWKNWLEGIDFFNKSNDADEIGLTWANVLVHEVLLPLKHDLGVPVVLIGHSFGARLLSRAIHSGSILPRKPIVGNQVDLFLGMQGAFSVNRFTSDRGDEGHPYQYFSQAAKKFILTSSRHDKAVKRAIHTGDRFVGSAHAFEITQENGYTRVFEHAEIDAEGRWTKLPSTDSTKVTMVEASAMIATNKPGTGGLAHSDVFDKEAGRFIWQAIKAIGIGP
ncbi:MAG: hypothetical protein AABZ17_07130 [Nitrospirota bacterium]